MNLWVVQFRFDLLSILGNDLFFFLGGVNGLWCKKCFDKKIPLEH